MTIESPCWVTEADLLTEAPCGLDICSVSGTDEASFGFENHGIPCVATTPCGFKVLGKCPHETGSSKK